MSIVRVELNNFRNQKNSTFELSSKTLLTGPNGSGKTSVIESIRLVSVGKSFRTSKIDDLIKFGEPYFRISVTNDDVYEFFYGTQFAESSSTEKRLTVNNKAISYMDFLGNFPTVVFSAKDVDVVTEQPSLRRQFLDGILWQADREFRRAQLEYGKVLRERAQLLFMIKINRASVSELQPWNSLLIKLSEKIRRSRAELVDFINKKIRVLEGEVPGKIRVKLEIESSDRSLEELQDQEIKLGHNLYGPHRDDLTIYCNDQLARRFSSRGQSRSVIALLKAIEANYLKESIGVSPVVLLDDIVSELDSENINWLFSVFGDEYQIVSTAVAMSRGLNGWHVIRL